MDDTVQDITAIFASFHELNLALSNASDFRNLWVAYIGSIAYMSEPKSTSHQPPPVRDPQFFSLDRRKHYERESSPTAFKRPNSSYVWTLRMTLLVFCIPAFLISIYSYDPSHSLPGTQDTFSSVCLPTQRNCLLHLHLPNLLVDPPAIVFITSVLGFFTLVFVLHGIRRGDIYQDRILAFGVICGSIWCGFWAIQEESVSAFKNTMPGVITATLATSAMIHTCLEKWSNA